VVMQVSADALQWDGWLDTDLTKLIRFSDP
jgi:hypothetical protein